MKIPKKPVYSFNNNNLNKCEILSHFPVISSRLTLAIPADSPNISCISLATDVLCLNYLK
jgi:hypothetical protein